MPGSQRDAFKCEGREALGVDLDGIGARGFGLNRVSSFGAGLGLLNLAAMKELDLRFGTTAPLGSTTSPRQYSICAAAGRGRAGSRSDKGIRTNSLSLKVMTSFRERKVIPA